MVSNILINIFKVFLCDFVVFLGIFAVSFIFYFFIGLIRNGKKHALTSDNIFCFCWKKFWLLFCKNCYQLLKWFVIVFIIHLILFFFENISSWLQASINYDSVPLFALSLDIIKPIFNVVLPVILPVIGVLLLFVLIFALVKTCQQRARKASACESFPLFTENLQKGLFRIIGFLPKIFIVVAVCIGLNSICLSIVNITKVFDDYKEIQELNVTLKNLSNSQAFARVSVLREKDGPNGVPVKTYQFDILNFHGDVVSSQTLELPGKEIVVDCINVNFDYSKIAQGQSYNIAYPYRVYSEVVAAARAVDLGCMFDGNVPVIYRLDEKLIYGLEKDQFYKRLYEIFDIIGDKNRSKAMGIKSSIGNAVHFSIHKGDVVDILIEGTGGISVKEHYSL